MQHREASDVWREKAQAYSAQAWLERVFDLAMLSSTIVAPAGLLFALLQFKAGHGGWALLGLVFAGLGATGVYARLVEPFRLRVKRIELNPAHSLQAPAPQAALRVVFFSDIHVGQAKRAGWTRRVVELVNAQQPDAVLMGGDFVADSGVSPDMLAPLGELRARLGVFAIFGNHDYGMPGHDQTAMLQETFKRLNIRLLRNECLMLDEHTQLVGIDEYWGGYYDLEQAFGSCVPAAEVNGSAPCRIVLGHNPDLMTKISEPADLFLFGHSHGGQIHLPFVTRFAVPVDGDLYRGEHTVAQGRVYISNGCGETSTPTRFGTPVEIVLITIQR